MKQVQASSPTANQRPPLGALILFEQQHEQHCSYLKTKQEQTVIIQHRIDYIGFLCLSVNEHGVIAMMQHTLSSKKVQD